MAIFRKTKVEDASAAADFANKLEELEITRRAWCIQQAAFRDEWKTAAEVISIAEEIYKYVYGGRS